MPKPLTTLILLISRLSACSANRTMALAIGWEACCSKLLANPKSLLSLPCKAVNWVTVISPVVSVPVLSNTSVSISLLACKASIFLTNTPISAARATPAMVESGIAKPSAQGQAIISTVVKTDKAKAKSLPSASQIRPLITAIVTTIGTKIEAILSTKCASGGLLLCEWRTALMTRANAVCEPTCSAL